MGLPQTRRPPLPPPLQRGLEWGLAWVLCAAILALAPAHPWPIRGLGPELASLTCSLGVGFLAILWHVRGRRPDLLPSAARLFLFAFVLRTAVLLILVSASLALTPDGQGYVDDDALYYGTLIRTFRLALGGDDPTWQREAAAATRAFRPEMMSGNTAFYGFGAWLGAMGAWTRVIGYSTVGALLPFVAIGCFLAVQCWVFLHDACSRRTANLAVLWALAMPDQLVSSVCLAKDQASAIGLLYLCELGSSQRVPRPRFELPKVAGAVLWMTFFRTQQAYIAAGLIAVLLGHLKLTGHWRRWFDVGAVALAAVIVPRVWTGGYGAVAAGGLSVDMGRYGVGLAVGLPLVPILKVSVTAFTRNVYITGMAGLLAALLWPLVMGLVAAGACFWRRLKLRYEASVVIVVLLWQITIAAGGIAISHKYRLPLDPLIVAFAAETVRSLRRSRPWLQRRAAGVAGTVTLLLYLLHLSLVVLFDIGR